VHEQRKIRPNKRVSEQEMPVSQVLIVSEQTDARHFNGSGQ